jgi:hypothetical protein
MAIELVVDTNVLKHASDDKYHSQEHCIGIIDFIENNNEVFLCLDESDNGHISYEYRKHCKYGSPGFAMLIKIAARLRFKDKTSLPVSVNQKINQTGIKRADRIFVWVAYLTNTKILVTQEHEDFTDKNRKRIKKEIGVKTIMSNECLELLASA